MERLLQPDTGLMVWTVIIFLGLVFVIGKFAWKPILQALNEREAGIRRSIEEAQAARQTAEQLKVQYEKELAEGQSKAQVLLNQAQAEAQKVREQIVKQAQEESERLSAQTKRQLEEEKFKLVRELRGEVASLSVKAAEKLIRHQMNQKVQDELLQEFFKDLEKQTKVN